MNDVEKLDEIVEMSKNSFKKASRAIAYFHSNAMQHVFNKIMKNIFVKFCLLLTHHF